MDGARSGWAKSICSRGDVLGPWAVWAREGGVMTGIIAIFAIGSGGIRTPVTLSGKTVFKTVAISRSATLPGSSARWSRSRAGSPTDIGRCLRCVVSVPALAKAVKSAAGPTMGYAGRLHLSPRPLYPGGEG